MSIKLLENKNTGGLSKVMSLGETAAGVATGNPGLIAGGFSGLSDSPLGKMAGLYGTASKVAGMFGGGDSVTGKSTGGYAGANLGVDTSMPGAPSEVDSGAMGRRMDSLQNSPDAVLHQGLQAADQLGMPFHIVEPLFQAKHFGKGGRPSLLSDSED